jgi:hypothetical protein
LPKIRITCAVCGFIGFIDPSTPPGDAGWTNLSESGLEGLCPACRRDEAPSRLEPEADKRRRSQVHRTTEGAYDDARETYARLLERGAVLGGARSKEI